MNHQDVISEVVRLTQVDSETCEKIIKSYESNASVTSVLGGIFGGAVDTQKIATTIASKTGISAENCENVLDALMSIIGKGMKDKVKF